MICIGRESHNLHPNLNLDHPNLNLDHPNLNLDHPNLNVHVILGLKFVLLTFLYIFTGVGSRGYHDVAW